MRSARLPTQSRTALAWWVEWLSSPVPSFLGDEFVWIGSSRSEGEDHGSSPDVQRAGQAADRAQRAARRDDGGRGGTAQQVLGDLDREVARAVRAGRRERVGGGRGARPVGA